MLEPTVTSSTQNPAAIVGSVPWADGSLTVRNASSTVWPCVGREATAFRRPATRVAVKPGRLSTTIAIASGATFVVVVSVHATLSYVAASVRRHLDESEVVAVLLFHHAANVSCRAGARRHRHLLHDRLVTIVTRARVERRVPGVAGRVGVYRPLDGLRWQRLRSPERERVDPPARDGVAARVTQPQIVRSVRRGAG